jgi:hypothetical protein
LDDVEATLDYSDSSGLSDYAYTNKQLNHDRLLDTTIYPHLHWFQSSSDVPNWLIQYRWQVNGQSKVTSWTSLKMNTPAFTYVSGTIMQICTTASGIAAPATDGISSIVQFRVIRDTANASTLFTGADPLTGDASGVSFDVHIEIDMLGSHQEYTK